MQEQSITQRCPCGERVIVCKNYPKRPLRTQWDTRHRFERLVARYGERCGLCGTSWHLVIDHVIPKARGGSDRFENLGLLCFHCNASKQARMIPDYRVPLDIPGDCTACLDRPPGARLLKHG